MWERSHPRQRQKRQRSIRDVHGRRDEDWEVCAVTNQIADAARVCEIEERESARRPYCF